MIDIGIGLPTRLAASHPDVMSEWMKRADDAPFSSLAVTDRVVSDALEPLIVLAVAAAATRRIRLLASVIIGPTRETTLLARQAASIEALSKGRLTLGLGVGAREDDYLATGSSFRSRGRRFDEQLEALRGIWLGETAGPVPARSGGPELLIGGYVDAVARRIAAWGDGYMAPGGGEPAALARLWDRIGSAWTEAGRGAKPRFVGGSYFALGPGADDDARAYIFELYGRDPRLAERRLGNVPTTAAAVRATVERWTGLGADEVVFRPCTADPAHIGTLADITVGISD